MKAGYAQTVITPSLEKPVYLAGFGQNRRAETVHDDLYARALSLSGSGCTLVLCALDLMGFFRPDVYEVIQRVRSRFPQVEIVMASTHTHHAPDMVGLWGPDLKTSGVDPLYKQYVKDQVEAAILGCLQDQRPVAAVRSASVLVRGVAKNARNPDILDEELTVLQLTGEDGNPLASLFNFPCHPEVLWEHNPHITSDYPATLRQEVEAHTRAACLFFAGGLGGMMTPDVQEHTFEEARRIGKTLAAAGLEALDSAAPCEPGPLQVSKKEIKVRLTNILYKLAFRRKLMPDVRDAKSRIQTEVNLVKVGGTWFVTVPGEILPRLGLQLKASLREAGAEVAGLIGLANDELGYILPKEDFKFPLNPFKPGKHYEETNSIGKDIGPQVMAAVESLL